jgi:hypothetical protein
VERKESAQTNRTRRPKDSVCETVAPRSTGLLAGLLHAGLSASDLLTIFQYYKRISSSILWPFNNNWYPATPFHLPPSDGDLVPTYQSRSDLAQSLEHSGTSIITRDDKRLSNLHWLLLPVAISHPSFLVTCHIADVLFLLHSQLSLGSYSTDSKDSSRCLQCNEEH